MCTAHSLSNATCQVLANILMLLRAMTSACQLSSFQVLQLLVVTLSGGDSKPLRFPCHGTPAAVATARRTLAAPQGSTGHAPLAPSTTLRAIVNQGLVHADCDLRLQALQVRATVCTNAKYEVATTLSHCLL